jgi:hypothetical protein
MPGHRNHGDITDGQKGKGDPSRPRRYSGLSPIMTRQLRGPRKENPIEFCTGKVAIIYYPPPWPLAMETAAAFLSSFLKIGYCLIVSLSTA